MKETVLDQIDGDTFKKFEIFIKSSLSCSKQKCSYQKKVSEN